MVDFEPLNAGWVRWEKTGHAKVKVIINKQEIVNAYVNNYYY